MKLDVVKIEDKGDLERERIVLRAGEDVDVGRYAVFKCENTKDGKVLASVLPGAFWFPDLKIKAGDFVVLYSKQGVRSEKKGTDGGAATYFYYWGYSSAQWKENFTAVLVELNTWGFAS